MLTQFAEARRIAPMVVEYTGEDTGPHTLFSFEPDATTLFESLLPRYVATRIFSALLEASASESASRRRAMKAASDNADDLIKILGKQGITVARRTVTKYRKAMDIPSSRQRRDWKLVRDTKPEEATADKAPADEGNTESE